MSFLTALAEMQTVYDRFMATLPDIPEFDDIPAIEREISSVIATPLARAKAAAWLRADLQEEEVLVVARMIGCNWRLDRQPSREETLTRRLRLVLCGLAPR